MSDRNPASGIVKPGTLGELFALYLQRQIQAENQGLAIPDSAEEFVPHDSSVSPIVEPQLAWKECQGIFRFFEGLEQHRIPSVPAGWSQLVNSLQPLFAIPMALGNFPQMMNHPLNLMNTGDLRSLRSAPGLALGTKELLDWAQGQTNPISRLFAAGILRLAAEFTSAEKLIEQTSIDPKLASLRDNELATLAWHAGNHSEAIDRWNRLPSSRPVLFNRAMASLFCGHSEEAIRLLPEVVSQFSEKDSWYHLAQLYLNLAEARV